MRSWNCSRVEVAGAFVHHGGDEVGDAFLARGILRIAALEGEAQGQERHVVLLDEPGLDAAGAGDLLGSSWRWVWHDGLAKRGVASAVR